MKLTSFPPIISEEAVVLVLGSMPGSESLKQQQYYAFARNSFWHIMGHICGARPELPYRDRVQRLQQAGIAVWDVLQFCEREGSLDSSIRDESEVPHDFAALLSGYRRIRCVLFNGRKAEKAFRRHVLDSLPAELRQRISMHVLPSTSPAYAGMSKEEKRRAWEERIRACLDAGR